MLPGLKQVSVAHESIEAAVGPHSLILRLMVKVMTTMALEAEVEWVQENGRARYKERGMAQEEEPKGLMIQLR